MIQWDSSNTEVLFSKTADKWQQEEQEAQNVLAIVTVTVCLIRDLFVIAKEGKQNWHSETKHYPHYTAVSLITVTS